MHTAKGCIEEIFLEGRHAARISCPAALIPAPGQYLLATSTSDMEAALAQVVYSSGACPAGFFAAPPLPSHWLPGAELSLRGPLGRGFSLPATARRVALAVIAGNGAHILALLEPALAQKASVALLTDTPPLGLPNALEILPLAALDETIPWADYLAIELRREHLPEILPLFAPNRNSGYAQIKSNLTHTGRVQALIITPMPCGSLAECGVCAVSLHPGIDFKLACKEGPVFDLL
jgi:hypothetical protein